jgi:hypothetical protein
MRFSVFSIRKANIEPLNPLSKFFIRASEEKLYSLSLVPIDLLSIASLLAVLATIQRINELHYN